MGPIYYVRIGADLFKASGFGLIYGLVESGIGSWRRLRRLAAGHIHDLTQSNAGGFSLALAAFMSACVFLWLAAPRRRYAL